MKTGQSASSLKTWWSSTTSCTLSPDFSLSRLWTGLCVLSLSLLLKDGQAEVGDSQVWRVIHAAEGDFKAEGVAAVECDTKGAQDAASTLSCLCF